MFSWIFKSKISSNQAAHILLGALYHSYKQRWSDDIVFMNEMCLGDIFNKDDGSLISEFYLLSVSLELINMQIVSPRYYPHVSIEVYKLIQKADGFGYKALDRIQNDYLAVYNNRVPNEKTCIEKHIEHMMIGLGHTMSPIIGVAVLPVLSSKMGVWKRVIRKHKIFQSPDDSDEYGWSWNDLRE